MRYHNSCDEWLLLSRNDGGCLLMNHFTKATVSLPSLSSYTYYQEPVEVLESYMIPCYATRGTWLDNKDRGAAAWSVNAHEECRYLSDMVFLEGKIYTIDRTAGTVDLIAINIVDEYDNEPRVSQIKRLIEGISLPLRKETICVPYLLESHGALLMIRKKLPYKSQDGFLVVCSNKFRVFLANFERHLWSEVRTLGNDQALFLGQGYSRAVHMSPYDFSRDCVFFLDDCPNWLVKYTTMPCGVHDMKDEKTYSPLPMVSWKRGKIRATWIFSQGETDKLQTEGED